MKILITGSNGLIGRPLGEMFQERGDEVIPYDLVFRRDIMERKAVFKYIRRADAVIHLAAQSGVEQARDAGYHAWQLNVVGTLNVLDACRLHDKPVVVASSNHIYGHGSQPTTEEAPQLQLDTYSATKHAADLMARSYAYNYGLRCAVVRNTNCFGPNDPHDDHIVPGSILSLLRGGPVIIRSNGKRVKSYLYVDDVAEAYATVLDWLVSEKGIPGTAMNVSADERITVLDLVRHIYNAVDVEGDPIVLGQPNDQADEWLDDGLMRRLTGWAPRHTLDEALAKTVAGFRARLVEA